MNLHCDVLLDRTTRKIHGLPPAFGVHKFLNSKAACCPTLITICYICYESAMTFLSFIGFVCGFSIRLCENCMKPTFDNYNSGKFTNDTLMRFGCGSHYKVIGLKSVPMLLGVGGGGGGFHTVPLIHFKEKVDTSSAIKVIRRSVVESHWKERTDQQK